MLLFLNILLIIESKKNWLCFPKKKKNEEAQLFSTLIIIRNDSWAANQHIRMISEGSCDAEDWSNDAENNTGINYIWTYIQIQNIYFKL